MPLQNLLGHTTKRIVSLQQEVILCAIESANDNKFICELFFNYGSDGSPGQAAYKQKFDSPGVKSDNSLFETTVIPLRLAANNNRFFECILHISYRHGSEKLQVRDKNRQVFNEQKQEVQLRFWETMSLLVDKPKANGSGSTTDGNTARRAFSQPELFARITNVDQNHIHNFKIILILFTCQQELDLEKF